MKVGSSGNYYPVVNVWTMQSIKYSWSYIDIVAGCMKPSSKHGTRYAAAYWGYTGLSYNAKYFHINFTFTNKFCLTFNQAQNRIGNKGRTALSKGLAPERKAKAIGRNQISSANSTIHFIL